MYKTPNITFFFVFDNQTLHIQRFRIISCTANSLRKVRRLRLQSVAVGVPLRVRVYPVNYRVF